MSGESSLCNEERYQGLPIIQFFLFVSVSLWLIIILSQKRRDTELKTNFYL